MFNMIKRTQDSGHLRRKEKAIITEDFKGNGYVLGLKVHGSYMGDGIHHYAWWNRIHKQNTYTHMTYIIICNR